MKKIVLFALPLIILAWAFTYFPGEQTSNVKENTGFAVVELFTSQGCSSCPPADAYLSHLIKQAKLKKQQIIALSFHVNYWNRLGWKDPYSDQRFTQRQQRYAEVFANNTIYTPQMIVNGNKAFESPRQNVIDQGIKIGLNTPAHFQIQISDVKKEENQLGFTINLNEPANDLHLNLALVEKGLTTMIKAGENGGKKLTHNNVVRSFVTSSLKNETQITGKLAIPRDMVIKNASLIAYLQSPDTMKILGASQFTLTKHF